MENKYKKIALCSLLISLSDMQASAPASQTPHVVQKNPAYLEIEKLKDQLSDLPAPSLFWDPVNNQKLRQERVELLELIKQKRQDWVKNGNKLVYPGNPEFYPGEIPEYIYAPQPCEKK